MIKTNGFKFIDNEKASLNLFIQSVEKIVNKYFNNRNSLLKLSFADFNKIVYKAQLEINKKHNPINLAKRFPDLFKNEFRSNKFYFQHYFYLRATRPSGKVRSKQNIDFHRETFQGPAWFKNIYNIWIPIKDCLKNNSIKYYPKSHKFIKDKDFTLKTFTVPIKKKSPSHKIGNLYLERKINFKNKKIAPKRLFKKNKSVLFSGELIHGSATNNTNKIRFSIDARFMLKKNFKHNIIQSANNKPYFKLASL